jgi:hypothetical protein
MMCINYTTYDIRCNWDTINLGMYQDIMVNSPETGQGAQPYWYARVIGIFHAYISSTHPDMRGKLLHLMEFLWVCWFRKEPDPYFHGFCHACLPKIGWVLSSDEYAFNFLDPAQVIRGAHIIPAFSAGHTSTLLPVTKTEACILNSDEEEDWVNFYVNM